MKRRNVMKLMRSTAFALVCCLTCVIIGSTDSVSPRAGADIYDDKIAATEAKIAENEKLIKELDGKIAKAGKDIANSEEVQSYYFQKLAAQKEHFDLLVEKIDLKEKDIIAKEAEIGSVEIAIADKEQEIGDTTAHIEQLDAQNRENIYKFGQILRTMYINDSDDVLSVIAGSTDFYEIFVRTEILENAKKQNLDFMNRLLDDIHGLEDERIKLAKDKEDLQDSKEALEQEKKDLEDERTALDEERKYSQTLISSYTSEYNDVTAQISNLEALQAMYTKQQKVAASEIEAYKKQVDDYIRQQQLAASNTQVYQEGDWRWPLDPQFQLVTCGYGWDSGFGRWHYAIDIGNGGINGKNIYAMKDGEVIVAKTTYTSGYSYGMYIVIDHGSGWQTLYGHCSAVYVSVGQKVKQGDIIGLVGSTGYSTGPHLHFELRKDEQKLNPLEYVKKPVI